MSKKFFIVIAVILVIFLLALVGYYFILKSNQTVSTTGKPLTFQNFFPFGGDSTTNGTSTEQTRPVVDDTIPPQVNFAVKLRKVSTEPVAGFGLFDSKLGTTLRHIEKSTGHVFETELFSPVQERISNTTMPKVYDAQWGSSSSTLVGRFLEDDNETIDTFSLTLKANVVPKGTVSTSTRYTTLGTLLPGRIDGYAVQGGSMFYISPTDSSSSGFTATVAGGSKKQIWDSPIRELIAQYVNSATVALSTKPYPNINGYLYFVDTGTGAVRRILGDIGGLSTLVSPDAKKVLALSENGTNQMVSYTVSDKVTQGLSPVTFPEKCVWSKKDVNIVYCAVPKQILDTQSLTNWYMGVNQYSDDIWKYDLKGNTSSIVTNLGSESGEQIDVIKPALSDSEQYLVFINKRDGALWSLDLTK